MIGEPRPGQRRTQQFAKAPLHAVADYRIADLLGDGDPEALPQPAVRMGKQHEARPRDTDAAIRREEIGPLADDGQGIVHVAAIQQNGLPEGARKRERAPEPLRGAARADARAKLRLRAERLAAAAAAQAEHLAAARARLASEKTVAASAHEVRRLECPLHRIVLLKSGLAALTGSANKKGRPEGDRFVRSARIRTSTAFVKRFRRLSTWSRPLVMT